MATGQMTKDDRTSEIAIFARVIKADEGDLSRDLVGRGRAGQDAG
jgi:hypothetical protein